MNAVDVLKYGHRTVCQVIEGLPEQDWNTGGVCGRWSAKDIIGHLAAFEHLLVDVLDGGETPMLDQLFRAGPFAFNDIEEDKRKSWPIQDVVRDYNDTQARTMELARRISADRWTAVGTLPWYGKEYSLDDYIVYAYYGHKREHSAQIAVFRDGLK
jgi:hypothetical protein